MNMNYQKYLIVKLTGHSCRKYKNHEILKSVYSNVAVFSFIQTAVMFVFLIICKIGQFGTKLVFQMRAGHILQFELSQKFVSDLTILNLEIK